MENVSISTNNGDTDDAKLLLHLSDDDSGTYAGLTQTTMRHYDWRLWKYFVTMTKYVLGRDVMGIKRPFNACNSSVAIGCYEYLRCRLRLVTVPPPCIRVCISTIRVHFHRHCRWLLRIFAVYLVQLAPYSSLLLFSVGDNGFFSCTKRR